MATVLIFRDGGDNQFLFGLLPALNEEKRPVANTELIKLSRGFVICASFALIISLLFCFRSSRDLSQVRPRASTLAISLKIFAILALLTTTLM